MRPLKQQEKWQIITFKERFIKNWIQFYSSEESYRQVEEIKIILDALANEASEKDKIVMKNHFATSCMH